MSQPMNVHEHKAEPISPPPLINPIGLFVWAIFANDHDGIYGDKNWNPTQERSVKRAIMWWLRNPFHHAFFNVIGVSQCDFTRTGRFPADVFNPDGGWNWAVTRYKWLRLPFVSYIGWCKFYVGWRERGNFGIKLTKGER